MSLLENPAYLADLDSGKSGREVADIWGIHKSTVNKHRARADVAAQREFFEPWDIPDSVVTSRGASIRTADGSWQKISWSPRAKALHDALQYDDLKISLDGWESTVVTALPDSEAVPILNASDLQIGKASQRGGGTPETLERVRQSVNRFADYLIQTRPRVAVLVDGGDPIENCWNTPAQLPTNDLDVPTQIRVFRRLMLEAIKRLAPLVETLYYVAVPSNHGQFRTGYKAPGGTTDADFGLEISHQLEDAIGENPHLQNVTFIRPDALYETAVLDLGHTKIAFHHGHQSSGPSGHGKWWAAQDHGRLPGWDADLLVTAHFHSLRVEQSGDGRWIIGVSSSDPGSDWYTNRAGESALSGMTSFDVLDGQWSNLRIL